MKEGVKILVLIVLRIINITLWAIAIMQIVTGSVTGKNNVLDSDVSFEVTCDTSGKFCTSISEVRHKFYKVEPSGIFKISDVMNVDELPPAFKIIDSILPNLQTLNFCTEVSNSKINAVENMKLIVEFRNNQQIDLEFKQGEKQCVRVPTQSGGVVPVQSIINGEAKTSNEFMKKLASTSREMLRDQKVGPDDHVLDDFNFNLVSYYERQHPYLLFLGILIFVMYFFPKVDRFINHIFKENFLHLIEPNEKRRNKK